MKGWEKIIWDKETKVRKIEEEENEEEKTENWPLNLNKKIGYE